MAEEGKKTYRLFALPLTISNIKIAADVRFSRATPTPEPGYVLIYTDDDRPNGAYEITENDANLLSAADKRWLFDSNAAIIAEEIELQKPDILRGLSERVEALETELKRKKEELSEKG